MKAGDIILTKTATGQSIWLSQNYIQRITGISYEVLNVNRKRYKKSVFPSFHRLQFLPDSGKSWRWGKKDGRFYYCYANIPDRSPVFYRSRLGNVEQLLKKATEQEHQSLNQEFLSYINNNYDTFLPAYLNANPAQQKALATACAVLDFAIQKRAEKVYTDSHLYKLIGSLIKRHEIKYIPANWRKLAEKVKQHDAGTPITEIIRLPRVGNKFAQLYTDPEVTAWVMQLRSMGQNYTNEYIIRKVSELCKLSGKPVPSRRWFGMKILESHETKYLTVNRFGKGARGSQMYEGYIPMKNALFAGDAWQVDATRFNLISHTAENGKKAFLYVIAVRDVHSGDILGYHFDYKEDRWAVINAVKMAVQETGYIPYEIVFDRFPGHNTPEAQEFLAHLKQLHTKVTFTYKATGKAGLERWFGTLQTVFMQESDYYYGQGIQSTRKYAHRSPEYLKKIRKDAHKMGFDFLQAVEEATKIIEAYRTTPFSYYSRKHQDINEPPKMLHAKSEKPNVEWIKDTTMSLLFGHKKEVSISRGGIIKTEIYKTEHIFQIDDFNLIKEYPKLWISYDLDDLSKVELFIKNGVFYLHKGTALAFEKIQPYGPQAEFNRIAKQKQRLAEIERQRQEALQQKVAAADESDLLMGRFTEKQIKEQAESSILEQAAGDEYSEIDDIEFDITQVRNQY